MKKSILFPVFIAVLAIVSCCSPKPSKDLVVYFSKTGGTRAFAEAVASRTGADIVELELTTPYPESYDATLEVSRDECAYSTGRTLRNGTLDLSEYGRIFIAYPVWYGTIAPPIVSLARDNDLFAGRDVVLMCTFGSGGTRTSAAAFSSLCPDARVLGAFGMSAQRVPLHAGQEADAMLAALASPKENRGLLEGYSGRRELNAADSAVFAAIAQRYSYLGLNAVGVCSQTAGDGTDYVFYTVSGQSSAETLMKVSVLQPGESEPELVEVFR